MQRAAHTAEAVSGNEGGVDPGGDEDGRGAEEEVGEGGL